MAGVQARESGYEATRVCVVGSSRLMGEALARLLAVPDRSIIAWGAQPAPAQPDHAPAEPHVVVLEVAELDGVAERAREIRARWPEARVVLVVRDDDLAAQQLATEIGASGCVCSRLGPTALARAVTGSLGNGRPPSARTGRPKRQPQPPTSGLERGLSRLTPREGEVLRLLVEGLSADAIAARLDVSSNTVRSHLQAVLSKLGVHNQVQAVAVAYRAGLMGHRPRLPDKSWTGTADMGH
jgi:two-component system, NarL family, nitrate/nitrite response regulator NarL